MENKHKTALLVIIVALGLMSFSALTFDLTSRPPDPTRDQGALINAWMDSIRAGDHESLAALACFPDAALKVQTESIRDILDASISTRLISTTEYPESAATKTQSYIILSREVREKNAYEIAILVISSERRYCVLGFALDRAFWPQRQQAQE
ncbi:MAG: hypothetical protein RBS68_15770 [Anaerolineales bacterium]|jgi:hypothetical protein|nr:hypothetical protein [Anaerolineales bacterium]